MFEEGVYLSVPVFLLRIDEWICCSNRQGNEDILPCRWNRIPGFQTTGGSTGKILLKRISMTRGKFMYLSGSCTCNIRSFFIERGFLVEVTHPKSGGGGVYLCGG